jgi:hypothetical protein
MNVLEIYVAFILNLFDYGKLQKTSLGGGPSILCPSAAKN